VAPRRDVISTPRTTVRWCLLMVPLLLVLLLVLLVAAAVGAAGRGRTPAAARLRRQHKTRLHHHPSSLRKFDDMVASVSAGADTVRRKTLTCEGVTTRALKAGLLSTEGDILAVARGIDAAGSVPRSAFRVPRVAGAGPQRAPVGG